ncbi:helix-turn-helix transcriptional regulator [Eggerthellaceae bacterium 24-137]
MALLFYYTLIIMFFYTIVAATSLSAFFVSHRRTFFYATIGFTFYFCDVSLVFKDNFITPDSVFAATSFYDVGNPYASIVTGGGAFLFLWLAACRYCREGHWAVRFLPVALWAVASLASYQLIGDPQWREFVYYNLRAVLQLFCYGVLAVWYGRSSDPQRRSIMKSHRVAYFCAIGLTCGIVLENVYFQLIYDPSHLPSGMWVLAERNPLENALFICFGLAVLHGAAVSLRLRARDLPEGEDPLIVESIDRLMPLFCQTYDLSRREEDVLRLALMGKDNQNIASELTLTAGTVKVHMHNILKKTGHGNRAELAADFWER